MLVLHSSTCLSRNPDQSLTVSDWGLGFDLVSLVPCLSDALGVVGVNKKALGGKEGGGIDSY